MSKVMDVASFLLLSYKQIYGHDFGDSELKLQKLMYLVQRQHLALQNEPLFEESFKGWILGPVLPELRKCFQHNTIPNEIQGELTVEEKFIIESVIYEFGNMTARSLVDLTHEETSWKNSRQGLDENENGNVDISIDDIKFDAANIRLYDYNYDMYLDEFDEIPHERILT
ncbi:Panacea domain-containing protein [Enterococcus faecium]